MFRFILTRAARAAVAVAAIPVLAFAQTGRVTGTVTDAGAQPVPGVQVLISAIGLSAEGGTDGKFVIRSVPAGTYELKVYKVGYQPKTVAAVVVTAGQDAHVAVMLDRTMTQLGGVVVSASRRVEKITDAPATITRIDDAAIQNTIGNSFAPALKEVKGIEFIQVGVVAVAVNARGFNSSFNNRMLMMEDGRIAALVESGLPVGSLTTISKVDLAGMEVLVGPGSALYGPDASNGVLTLQTKDPKQYPGYTIELSGGSRNFYDAQARWADVTTDGKWGYKLTGEYQAANDWQNAVYYPQIGTSGPLLEKNPDFRTDVTRGTGSLARYFDNGARLQLTAGISKLNGIGQTSVGRNQLVNYGYRDYQLQYTGSRWFAQAYMTNSVGGGTFQLNGFTQNSVRFPTLTADSVRKLSAFPGDGRMQAAELQNNFSIGMFGKTGVGAIDDAHITWGGQFRRDRVSSYRDWLSDRQTGQAIVLDQKGGYAQIESPLADKLRLVLSGRYDDHDKYDPQFSPKAALLFSPVQDQTIRVTYNRAFKSPTVLQTDFYFPNFQPFVGVFGNTDGFVIKNAAGAVVNTITPIRPEVNNTWELGYKGVVAGKLYVDVAGYHSVFTDFMSPLVVIANPLLGAAATTAYDGMTGAKITDPAGGPQIALTYFNVGEATITGVDAGLRYYFTDNIAASGNVSLIKVDTIKASPTAPEATAFNSASTRITAGMDFTEIASHTNGAFTIRYVNGYDFRSGVNWGLIPGFATFDLSANYKIPNSGARITLQVQNLFACVSGTSTPPAIGINSGSTPPAAPAGKATYTSGQQCGFGQTHSEMINMPQIGTMAFLGVRWDGR